MTEPKNEDCSKSPSLPRDVSDSNDDYDNITDEILSPEHRSLKKHLLGPSVLKSGQENVDQTKVSEIIYEASKGSKYFKNEERKDQNLTERIERILLKKAELEKMDLTSDIRRADLYIAKEDAERDLSQTIVHVDCDAFYASVEELDHPEYKTVPMAVGKGVLTTCNYEARKFGCRSGMAGHIAKKLCPHLIFLPLNFSKYMAKAKEIREVLAKYDDRFEAASCDEAYLNITNYLEEHEDLDAWQAVEQLRGEVFEHAKVTISAGIAPNGRLAKISSNQNKPNGQFQISNERSAVMGFMKNLPIRKVNGVGRVFERELNEVGISTCGDIYAFRGLLAKLFGVKAFEFLVECFLGLGRTNIKPVEEYIRKSIGTESTFRDIWGTPALREKLRHTAESLEQDMEKHQLAGRTLCLKVKEHTYKEAIRQKSVPKAIWKADDIYEYALPLLDSVQKEFDGIRLRLMGLRMTHLVSLKKIDVMKDFFKVPEGGIKRKAIDDNGEWESWPEEEWGKYDEAGIELDGVASYDEEDSPIPDETVKETTMIGETWPCPICSRPQKPDDKTFNEHVDYCLSRQTILEAVQETTTRSVSPEKQPISKQSLQEKTTVSWMIRDTKDNKGAKSKPSPSGRGRPRKKPNISYK